MFGREAVEGLRLRKQALVLESELNRLTLEAEWRNVRHATAWTSKLRRGSPWLLLLLAPLAGLLTARAARAARQPDTLPHRLLSLLKWLQPLWTLWQRFGAARGGPEHEKR